MPVVRELVTLFRAKTDKRGFNEVEKLTRGIKSLATTAAAAFTASELFQGFNAMVQVASDATERLNVLEVGFGKNTTAVQAWAQSIATSFGRSRADVENFVGMSQVLLSSLTDNAEASQDMSKEIAKLAIDMGSFYNIPDQEAFTTLRSGLSGETEPMKRFGVVLTENALDAFALSQGLNKTVREMTEAEKTVLRFNVIMAKTQKIQGDAARTSGTLANVQKALRAAIKDVQEDLGKFYIPAITKLKKEALDTVRAIGRWIKENRALLKQRIGKFMEGVVKVFRQFSAAIVRTVDGVQRLWGSLTEGERLLLKLQGVFLAFGAVMAAPFGPAILGFLALFALADDLAVFFSDSGGKSIIGLIVNGFKDLAGKISFGPDLLKNIEQTFNEMRRLFNTAITEMSKTWEAFSNEGMEAGFTQLLASAGTFAGDFVAILGKTFIRVVNILSDIVEVLIKTILFQDKGPALKRLKEAFSEFGVEFGNAFIEEFQKDTPDISRFTGKRKGGGGVFPGVSFGIPTDPDFYKALGRQPPPGVRGAEPFRLLQPLPPINIEQYINGPVDPDAVGKATKTGIQQGARSYRREMQQIAPAVRQ